MMLPKPLDDARKTLVNPRWAIGLITDYAPGDILHKRFQHILWFKPQDKYNFYADCFITSYFGEPLIFFENWESKRGTGTISYVSAADVCRHAEDIEPYVHTALEGETHFSYPYLFEYEGGLYMIPENFQSGELAVYRADGSPDRWEKAAVVLPDYQGIDPVIFHHRGLWWLFVTPYSSLHRDAERKLEIWYAENPFGTWTPHAMNPILYDTSIARNGGRPFVHEGVLYRPTQDCSRTYGGELAIMRIDTLTREEFSESVVSILPGYAPYAKAFHTFSCSGDMAVIDGNAAEYSLRMPLYFVKYVMNIFRKK